MKPLNLLLAMLLLALIMPFASASVAATIDMKTSFGVGEKVYFNYTLASDANAEITYAISIACPDAPMPLIVPKTASIAVGTPFEGTYVYMESLDESIEPQQCTATLSITSPLSVSASAEFELRTKPSFSFALEVCKDSACKSRATVFEQNNKAYLQYDSSIANPALSAVLSLPDGTSRNITLPSELILEQIGNYSLEATASKDGFKVAKQRIIFGTVKSLKIDASEGNAAEQPFDTNILLYTLAALAVIAVAAAIVLRRRKKK